MKMNKSVVVAQNTSKISWPGAKYFPTLDSVTERISGIVVPGLVVVVLPGPMQILLTLEKIYVLVSCQYLDKINSFVIYFFISFLQELFPQ